MRLVGHYPEEVMCEPQDGFVALLGAISDLKELFFILLAVFYGSDDDDISFFIIFAT